MNRLLADYLARAGGGHSFSGGSSGGAVHTYSGGGYHSYGSGSGGGSGGAVAVIVILVAVVGVFGLVGVTKMRSRRGRDAALPSAPSDAWDNSGQPAIGTVRGDLFPGSAASAMASDGTNSSDGLAAISAHDPGFSQEEFLERVQQAFFVVQEAWSQRKPEMSRQVMADRLWQQHRVQIQGYLDGHKRNMLDDLAVGNLTILGAHHDATYDTVTVRVTAACADYDVDDQSGKVVRGNRHVEQWREDWTFQRSATAVTPTGGGTLAAKCPNCGGPLDLDLAGTCKYCKAPVSSGSYDWVLARIAQV